MIIYYVTLPLIFFISLLPFWWLYRLSDILFVILYSLIGYRKGVVIANLRNSFPEKTEDELHIIRRNFYRYFCDLVVETIKSLTISPAVLQKRLVFRDTSLFQRYYDQKKSIILVMGHLGNWELGGARFAIEPLHRLYIIYHPLSNPYFDRLMYKMRTRLGNGLYAMNDTLRGMIRNKSSITATAFIADQTPSVKDAFWMEFLHQDTPFFTGMGKVAKKMNYPVLYVAIKRVKRGYYDIQIDELVARPSEMEPGEIVSLFFKKLEQDIRDIPETWLWSHRRWKHKRSI
jgi:KDO2-lipid IV(A) lauroyltransferase